MQISAPFKLGFNRIPVNNAIGLLPSLLSKLFKREVDLSFVKIYQKHMIKEFFLFICSICTKTSQVRNLQLIIFFRRIVTRKELTNVARKPDEAYDIWVCFFRVPYTFGSHLPWLK